MTDREHFRDEALGAALRELEAPTHRDGFEDELRRLLAEERPRPALRRWAPAAAVVGGTVVAAVVLLLVGLPGGKSPSPALAARVKALVGHRFATGQTLSGRIVYRSFGLIGPSSSQAFVAMDALGNLRVRDPQTHATAVYEESRGVERSLNTSAAIGGTTLFASERRGVAPGPPDGGPSDAFLQRQLSAYARALLAEPDPRVHETKYEGRKAWRASIDVTPNRRSPDYDRFEITIDAATGMPVEVVGTLRGETRFVLRVERLAVNARLPAGVFALQFPRGQEVLHEDDGFRRVDLSDVDARVGYRPLVPQAIPNGFRYDTAAVAQRSQEASTGVANPPSRKVVSISYRRGFEQFLVTSRLRHSGSNRWQDPLGVDGVALRTEHVTLGGGALAGAVARIVVDPRVVPHLWALAGNLVITISGDLSRNQLIAVAESLQRFDAASGNCGADQLQLAVALQGATGALLGNAEFTNTGKRTCTLVGSPHVVLERGSKPLAVQTNAAKPAYPPVQLDPGSKASVSLTWRNWCGGTVDRLALRAELPSGGRVSTPMPPDAPRCDDASSPSTLGIGWFRPR